MPGAASNPADALITAIESWGSSAHQIARRRGVSRGDATAWRAQNKLVRLLEECEQMLDEIAAADADADVDVHRADLVGAYTAVYGMSPSWTQEGALPDLTPLRRLSGVLRLHLRGSDVGVGVDRSVLEQALLEVLSGLEDADYLSESARAYLVTLVTRALSIVRDESSTVGALRSCSHEVAGALVGVAKTTAVPTERKSWFKQKADVLATAVLTTAAAAGVNQLIEAGEKAMKVITAGN